MKERPGMSHLYKRRSTPAITSCITVMVIYRDSVQGLVKVIGLVYLCRKAFCVLWFGWSKRINYVFLLELDWQKCHGHSKPLHQQKSKKKNIFGLKQSSKRQHCLKQNLITLLNLKTFKHLDASLKKSGKVGQDFKWGRGGKGWARVLATLMDVNASYQLELAAIDEIVAA